MTDPTQLTPLTDPDAMRTREAGPTLAGQWTEGAVRYFTVADAADAQPLGALWAADGSGQAAGWVTAGGSGKRGLEEQTFWRTTITEAQRHPEWSSSRFLAYWQDATVAGRIFSAVRPARSLEAVAVAVGAPW
jgi:hypothetical protein